MTITNSTSKVVHKINLEAAVYPFPFKIFKPEELLAAAINPSNAKQIDLTLGDDYLVTGEGEDQGGEIALTDDGRGKLADGWNLVLTRRMAFEQQIGYRPYDLFPVEIHERALDILTMQDQQLREMISRALLAPLDAEHQPNYTEFLQMQKAAIQAADAAKLAAAEADNKAAMAKAAAEAAAESAALAQNITSVGPATSSRPGLIQVGDNLQITKEGLLSGAPAYALPMATAGQLGGVKIGRNLAFDNSGLLSAHSALPPGSIIMHAAPTAPEGFMVCNGAAVLRTVYNDLFIAIGVIFGQGDGVTTFNLPDLRGEFIRGWDQGRDVDRGRAFGSIQSDMLKSHTHIVPTYTNNFSSTTGWVITGASVPGEDPTTSATGGNETRPRNMALLFCIKY